MDGALYDEFGNYIGPDLDNDESESEEDDEDELDEAGPLDDAEADAAADAMDVDGAAPRGPGGAAITPEALPESQAVVLHEDKKYYPSADEVYGAGVETLVMDEDAQPLEVPIVAPPKDTKFEVHEGADTLQARYPLDFLRTLLDTPTLARNVAVVGHLHHGKTALVDTLVYQTHHARHEARSNDRMMRYTDARLDEQTREISIKMCPISLVLQNLKGKSYLFNLMDAPGHVHFLDETTAALQLADGALLCVDAVEGVMLGTEHALRQAALQGCALTLCITKVDRLITELKLPPADAYFKLRHIVQECNSVAAAAAPPGASKAFDPLRGNVAFSCGLYNFSFTLESFAQMYCNLSGAVFDPRALAARLWGDLYFHKDTRTFKKAPPEDGGERTFVSFVLEPLYKIFSTVLGEDTDGLRRVLSAFGAKLKPRALKQDIKPLMADVCSAIFGQAAGLAEMLVRHVPSAQEAAADKAARLYTGPQDSVLLEACKKCSPHGPVCAYVGKLFPSSDASHFEAFARVFSGTVSPGDKVRVLGEAYSADDEEDSAVAEVTAVSVYMGRYRIPVKAAGAGSLVLLDGIDFTIAKTATLVPEVWDHEELCIFRPLQFTTAAVVKIATEPLNPSELPKMVEGLRKINKSYPLAVTKVEESGEHTILGTGELYLDSLMKDLRELYADVEVKVADPVVTFCETIVETSSLQCFAETPNKRNKLTMVAEPLDAGLGDDIERGAARLTQTRRELKEFFGSKYGWDVLAVRGLWAFGPEAQGPNVLLDDTLTTSAQDKDALSAARDSIVQGFQWGVKEGPLCDEPLRNVKFKLTEAAIATEPLHRGGGQLIPTARRVLYSAFLLATPRLMEPVYFLEVMTPPDCITAVYTILSKRRGHLTADVPKPGTPIYIIKAQVPVIESFGLEADIRYHTQGQAFCMGVFDSWQIVPGDPLDKAIILRPLEPAATNALAREFMVKTRRRKGMGEDVSINKFFDDPMLLELAKHGGSDLYAMM